MFNIRKNKKGFTLVELIVVIASPAILAGTAAGIGVTLINKNSNKVVQTDADHLANDFKIYMQDKQENFDINSYDVFRTSPSIRLYCLSYSHAIPYCAKSGIP